MDAVVRTINIGCAKKRLKQMQFHLKWSPLDEALRLLEEMPVEKKWIRMFLVNVDVDGGV